MDKKDIATLIQKYLDGNSTAEERTFLESWYLEKAREASDVNHDRLNALNKQLRNRLGINRKPILIRMWLPSASTSIALELPGTTGACL